MGIQVEFNPDLALRRFGTKGRLESECLPENLKQGKTYEFLKKGQRNYWLEGEIPLLETKGDQQLSRPLASIRILEASHFLIEEQPHTKGLYKVIEVFDPNNPDIKFESYKRVR
ncbi:MAG: hypothetical protein AABX54_02540 [Nanoarchaeota archaeon]